MKKHIKKYVNATLNKADLEIRRASDPWVSQQRWNEIYEELFDKDSLDHRRLYNIGAGGFRHWAWTNIDKCSDWYASQQDEQAVIDYDLMTLSPLPVETETAEIIYTSHTIEHITDDAVHNLLAESYRALKKGGYLRITCPNFDLDYRAYQNNDREYFYWQYRYSNPSEMKRSKYLRPLREASIEELFLLHVCGNVSEIHADGADERLSHERIKDILKTYKKEDALNKFIEKGDLEKQKLYPGNHINWWNPDKLITALHNAGFKNPYVSAYGQSACPVLRDTTLFDNTHPKVSMYIEARKDTI